MDPRLHLENAHGYGSEFSDYSSEIETTRKKNEQANAFLNKKPDLGRIGILVGGKSSAKPSKRVAHDLQDVEEGKRMRYHGLLAMDAYTRHKKLVNDYLTLYGGKLSDFKRDRSKDRTDYDVIKENHQFVWDDDEEMSWGKQLAKKYWDKLYKEYTICDLSKYKEKKIAFRWRVEKEVISGKGQFSCANKRCAEKDGLRSWEVNFLYVEDGEKKNALVKCRLCPSCSSKLNYYHRKKDVTGLKRDDVESAKHDAKGKRKKKKHSKSSDDSDEPSTSSAKKSDPSRNQDNKVWSQPLQIENEKTREEEFDKYFDDLFL